MLGEFNIAVVNFRSLCFQRVVVDGIFEYLLCRLFVEFFPRFFCFFGLDGEFACALLCVRIGNGGCV